MNLVDDHTIAAISTPPGSGGVAMIRVSGPEAILIVDRFFSGSCSLTQVESHRACFGRILERPVRADKPGEREVSFVDEVVVTVFRAPHSYTMEDVVELTCHGGAYLTTRILGLLLNGGARLAEPGEFSKRAFLNGRLDLSQAEAVADLIHARSEATLQAALSQYKGIFSEKIRGLRQALVDLCALLELELDFAEEDVKFAERKEVAARLDEATQQVSELLDSYNRGRILRDGAKLVIAGRPNVGKSSLMNALLKEERAIVTNVPGTTRDVLEEQLNLRGVLFRIIDTAGIRQSRSTLEQEGVKRSRGQMQEADVLLLMFDGSQALRADDRSLIQDAHALLAERENLGIVAAINKSDLSQKLSVEKLSEAELSALPLTAVSAKTHAGFEKLEQLLVAQAIGQNGFVRDEPLVTNLRQKEALEKAREALINALKSLQENLSYEFVAVDLRAALDHLGEVIGEVTTEDILDNIFSRFCIGK